MIEKEKLEFIESITLKNTLREAFNFKKQICLAIVTLAVAGGAYGFIQAKQMPNTEAGKANAAYDEAIASYDKSLALAKKNLNTSELQLKKQQEYMDKSPLMKIDPQKQQFGELSYRVDAKERIGDVIQSYNNFVNRGWLAKELSAKYKADPAEYLKEGITSGNNGTMWTVTVTRKDEKQVKELLTLIKAAVANHNNKVSFEHKLSLVREIYYARADAGTLKNQNGHRDTIRRYSNDVNNYGRQLVEIQKQKINYERMYQPNKYKVKDPMRAAGSYGLFGAFMGLLLPLGYFALKSIISNKINSVEELAGLKIPILSVVSANGLEPSFERTIVELELLSRQQGNNGIYLACMTAKEMYQDLLTVYTWHLGQRGIRFTVSSDLKNDAAELRTFVAAGKAICMVKLGETSYKDVEQFIQLCRKFNVEIWGFIVVA